MARFRRGEAFHHQQSCAQVAAKFELVSLTFSVVRQKRQLIQCLLKLCGRFRHCRAGSRSPTGTVPIGNGFFNESRLGIMLSEKLGLAVHQLGEMGCKRVSNLCVQLLARTAQQAAMCRVLHQRVLEAVDGLWRSAALEHKLRSNETVERRLQLVLWETGDGMQ